MSWDVPTRQSMDAPYDYYFPSMKSNLCSSSRRHDDRGRLSAARLNLFVSRTKTILYSLTHVDMSFTKLQLD